METAEVGLYLFVTCVFASLLLSPVSPVRHFIGSAVELRALMGLAVGATVVAIVISSWGKGSQGSGLTSSDRPLFDLSAYSRRQSSSIKSVRLGAMYDS